MDRPPLLTERVYSQLMGDDTTARERLDMWAYLLAGKTEYWRAHRKYAGIIHFVYLTCSYPGVYTSDHFRDVTNLELDPAFADYVRRSFQAAGRVHQLLSADAQGGRTACVPSDDGQ